MAKAKLIKAVMFGAFLSVLTTGTVYAQSVAGSSPAYAGSATVTTVSDKDQALYDQQKKIDQYIFNDHAKEIEAKGILVNYTGITDNNVEIGISPYSEENAEYFYKIFGKDGIKVVKFDESVIYATTSTATASGGSTEVQPVEQTKAPDTDPGDGRVYKGVEVQTGIADDANVNTSEGKTDANNATTDQVNTSSEAVAPEADAVYDVSTAELSDKSAEIKTVSATDQSEMVKRDSGETGDRVSTPFMILGIAGVAALAGGAIIVTGRNKSIK